MFLLTRGSGAVGLHLWHHHGAFFDHGHDHTFCPRRQRIWVLSAAILVASMGFMDRINISIAMPTLREDLGSTLVEAQWISNSYLLMMSSLILICTAAGERFGLRRVMSAGVLVFTLGATGCALAPSTGLLIATRAVEGIGAALMVPSSLAIVAKAYPKAERGRAIGIWAAASSILLVVGPLAGGSLLTALGENGWRLLFGLNLPIGCIALSILWGRVPEDPLGAHRHIDRIGGLLATVALFLIAFGLTDVGDESGVRDGHRALIFVGMGVLVLGAFVWWEARSKEPLVPLSLFSNKSFSGANAVTFLNDFAISANLFFLPMAAIAGWGETAASVSVLFLPLPIMVTLLSEPSGLLADRFGPAPLVAIGSLLVAAACAGLALAAYDQELWSETLPLMCLMAFGQGLLVSPLSTAVLTSEEDDKAIVACGVNNAISRSAWLISVAAMGAVAALVFHMQIAGTRGEAAGVAFGVAPTQAIGSQAETIRMAASDAAYAALAWITAILAAVSALIAAATLGWRPPPIALAPNQR